MNLFKLSNQPKYLKYLESLCGFQGKEKQMNKPIYRQTYIKNYFECQKKLKMSMNHKIEKEVFREGLLFEGYVLGFKDEVDENKIIGKKRPETLDRIKDAAALIKPLLGKGINYKKLEHIGEEYTLRGEADFMGEVSIADEKMDAIVDLKYTKDIYKNWIFKNTKSDFLQAIMYTYITYLKTDMILPFVYLIVENNKFSDILYKPIVIKFTKYDFKWLENLIKSIDHNVKQDSLCGNRSACLENKYKTRCDYLEFCSTGRERLNSLKLINFNDLKN